MIRDFTFIDDIIESIRRLIKKPPLAKNITNLEYLKPDISWAPFKIFNFSIYQIVVIFLIH